jgi:hypothetical protein
MTSAPRASQPIRFRQFLDPERDIASLVTFPVYEPADTTAERWVSVLGGGRDFPCHVVTVSHRAGEGDVEIETLPGAGNRRHEARRRDSVPPAATWAVLHLLSRVRPDPIPTGRGAAFHRAVRAVETQAIASWDRWRADAGSIDGRPVVFRSWSFGGRTCWVAQTTDGGFVHVSGPGSATAPPHLRTVRDLAALMGGWAGRPLDDLTAFLQDQDRRHPPRIEPADGLHPDVLRLLERRPRPQPERPADGSCLGGSDEATHPDDAETRRVALVHSFMARPPVTGDLRSLLDVEVFELADAPGRITDVTQADHASVLDVDVTHPGTPSGTVLVRTLPATAWALPRRTPPPRRLPAAVHALRLLTDPETETVLVTRAVVGAQGRVRLKDAADHWEEWPVSPGTIDDVATAFRSWSAGGRTVLMAETPGGSWVLVVRPESAVGTVHVRTADVDVLLGDWGSRHRLELGDFLAGQRAR